MRFLRFSLRRLLIVTGLVAVLLYVLILRPTVIAKQFIQEVQTSNDVNPILKKYFYGVVRDAEKFEGCNLEPRTWADVFACKQRFTVIMRGTYHLQIEPPEPDRTYFTHYRCYTTPFRIKLKELNYLHKN